MAPRKTRARAAQLVALVALIAVGLAACSSNGDDKSDKSDKSSGGAVTVPAGETGTPVAVEVGEDSDSQFFLKVSPASVSAGKTTFTMRNTGTKEHEMVVLKTDTPADQLTVKPNHRLSEDESVGEVGETAAGKTGTITLDLEPGNYILVCNIARHYEKGMYAVFTVT